jgi:hypothetical protein
MPRARARVRVLVDQQVLPAEHCDAREAFCTKVGLAMLLGHGSLATHLLALAGVCSGTLSQILPSVHVAFSGHAQSPSAVRPMQ